MSMVIKMLVSMGTKLLTEALLEELVLFILRKLAESSKTKIDDEIYNMVEKHLNK